MADRLDRRQFVTQSLAGGAACCAAGMLPALWPPIEQRGRSGPRGPSSPAKADSVIFIWLPGGVAQTDTWDPKQYTPFEPGMKGSELLGTCPSIPTSVDGLRIGEGLENMASVMHHGTVLRSLTNETKFGAVHLKAQYYMMTGYLFPVGLKAPSIGAAVARTLGPRRGKRAALHLHRPRHRHQRHREAVHQRVHRPGLLRREACPVHDPRSDRKAWPR